ncbi:conserved hypothetical protein [Planktothrix sp. PCC 11201]|uniref:CRISPR-associated protein Csx3 n=1 Tax=Planktothrix sp. PCC 11201 TaxID=1729650 RepID=UPI0009110EFA|nr:CRISPR-associated protein Csx3 [Planktothrix sp. PCC 11201]SKB13816.1 conserved hypothetical protein [Planktothrix sp. PCC 11201]
MYTYQLRLEGDILKVGFNRIQPAQGDQIVRDAFEQLEQMIASGEISGGSGVLKIDGPQSVPVAYVIAHRLAHLYEAIAVLDPKIGSKGCKTYIVTMTHGSSNYQIGDLICSQESQIELSKIKVVLCGPPRSGKSCLREGLKTAILGILGAPYPYIITACQDGEGAWYQKTYASNQSLAENIKPANKGDITPEFAQAAAQWVRSANQLINIIDVGGKMSDQNQTIMAEATHAVILAGNPTQIPEWTKFCQNLGLKVIAEIYSDYQGTRDEITFQKDWVGFIPETAFDFPFLKGSIHYLKRGEDFSNRPMITALANLLVKLTKF